MMLVRLLSSCIMILILCDNSLATSPAEVVDAYCQLDGKGYRAGFGDYGKIVEIMAWEEEQSEPGWDCNYIIKDYKIESINIINETAATVDVKYFILAMYCADFSLKRINLTKKVTFELVAVEGDWRIKKYIVYPRVFLATGISILKKQVERLKKNDPKSNKLIELDSFIKQFESLNE